MPTVDNCSKRVEQLAIVTCPPAPTHRLQANPHLCALSTVHALTYLMLE